jgi:ribosomal protein L16/L10AE
LAGIDQPVGHQVETREASGWPVRLTSFRLGGEWICVADNVDPGATIARARADSREAAIEAALRLAGERLGRTRLRS